MDLNADLAEGDELGGDRPGAAGRVTSASLACGFHAGSRRGDAVRRRGLRVTGRGDRRPRLLPGPGGFGRRPLDVAPDRLAADLVEQWETLAEEVAARRGDRHLRQAPRRPLQRRGRRSGRGRTPSCGRWHPGAAVLVGPPAGAHAGPAAAAGVAVVPEGFCDRGYDAARSARRTRLGRRARRRPRRRRADGPGRWPSTAVVDAVDGTWVALGRARRSASTATTPEPSTAARAVAPDARVGRRRAARPSPRPPADGVTERRRPGRAPAGRPVVPFGDRALLVETADVAGRPRPGRRARDAWRWTAVHPARSRRSSSGSPACSSSSTRPRPGGDGAASPRGSTRGGGRRHPSPRRRRGRRPCARPPGGVRRRRPRRGGRSRRHVARAGRRRSSSAPSSRWPSSGSPPGSPT